MRKPKNQILVIFGASGDLTKRKLIPALFDLYKQKLLPQKFAALGTGRTDLSDDVFREKMSDELKKTGKTYPNELRDFLNMLHYIALDPQKGEDFYLLKDKLEELDVEIISKGNFIYYLATPPALYKSIPENLAKHNLNMPCTGEACKKIIVEKPFGIDLESALDLNKDLLKNFSEHQIYRIDHYLGKETVQNLLVTRFANVIFEPLWNRNYIDHIEVTSAESLGVESRGGYYDHSGALRDMVQNHLLQIVGLATMEPPAIVESTSIRNEILKVYQSFKSLTPEYIQKNVIRGQYTASTIQGEKAKGYREEVGVDPMSKTETYFAMKFFIDNWRWAGVPIYIRTGKRLPTRVTEIVIHFKKTPHHIFQSSQYHHSTGDNILVIRIQPDEGILLKFGMKVPGAGFEVQHVNMDFHYSQLSDIRLPSAYERLLLDCMHNDATLYARGDIVEEAWKFVQPVLDAFYDDTIKIYGYPAGTWGPSVADDLVEGKDKTWRYPCKNLANDGIYCEL